MMSSGRGVGSLEENEKIKWDVALAMLSSMAGALIGIGLQAYLDYTQIPSWARMVEAPIGIGMFLLVLRKIWKSPVKRN